MTSLHGTGLLLRHQLRRDRILAPAWIGVLVVMCVASAAATPSLYPSAAERVHAAQAINHSPAIVALYGPILDVRSVGELAMTKMTVTYAVLVAVFLVIVVRRHTRIEEESGRAELVGGTAVGRDAPLAAAAVEGAILSITLGTLAAVGTIAGGLDAHGSAAFGAMWAGTGLVAVGMALVANQVSASARTCAAAVAAMIGTAYLTRAVGDTSWHWLSWLSPFGWNTQLRAWSDTRWWVLGLDVALAGLLAVTAVALRGRRDLGAGLLAARPGPADGSPRLADALSLALKVHSTALITWSVAMAAWGTVFGLIAPGISDLIGSSGAQDIIERLGGELIGAVLSFVALIVSCFAIQVVTHTAADESAGRTEAVLATATSRTRWIAATLAVSLLGSAWLMVVAGAGLWVGYLAADGHDPIGVLTASLAWIPAVWTVAALAAAIFALRSRLTALAWALPLAFLALTLVADLLDLPGWVAGLSPFAHVPLVPAASFDWEPELGLLGATTALTLFALWRFRRRDVA